MALKRSGKLLQQLSPKISHPALRAQHSHRTCFEFTRVFQGYNDKPLELMQQDKVSWENKLLGGWTVQQWRSGIKDCLPTSVEFNICPGDEAGKMPPRIQR